MQRVHVYAGAALLLALASPSFAAGTTSASFLRLGSGARAAAMGDAFTARADDASATYWNPAGLSRLPGRELMAEHVFHIQDISINRVAYVHPLAGSPGAFGVSVTHLSLNGIEGRTGNTPTPDRTFGASDSYAAVSYAHPVGRALSLGITGKFIRQQIDTFNAATVAADVGLLYTHGRFRFGAALTNVGPDLTFVDEGFPLPRSLRAGVAYDVAAMPLKVSIEAEALKGESDPSYRIGAEWGGDGMLSLRGGWLRKSDATQAALKGGALGSSAGVGRLVGLAGGFGLKLSNYRFDYAFTPFGGQGAAHKMTFTAGFGR